MRILENMFYIAATGLIAKETYDGYTFIVNSVIQIFQPVITALGM